MELNVVIGVDAHKRSHTFVAVDDLGREPCDQDGGGDNRGQPGWAGLGQPVTGTVVGGGGLPSPDPQPGGRPAAGRRDDPPGPDPVMADARKGGRQPGKSDPIDALAVARAALREPGLPAARLDGAARDVRLLVDHREDLVNERTRIQCRLRWHLHELAPDLDVPAKSLRRRVVLDRVRAHLAGLDGLVAAIAMELVDRCVELTRRADELEKQLRTLVADLAPSLLGIPGCGVLTAAKIIGETAGVDRFKSKDAYARFNGTAPIPAWSGNPNRQRLNRGGNRQVNAALHRIAVTQLRMDCAGRAYIDRLVTTGGKTKTEALRLLRRRLSDVVFRTLLTDHEAGTIRSAGAGLAVAEAA